MHEMSVAMEICRIAEDQVGLHALSRVRQIGLIVGLESGVEPDNLMFCLEALLEQPPFTGASTAIELASGDVLRVDYLDMEDERPPN